MLKACFTKLSKWKEPKAGLEPATYSLRMNCSTNWAISATLFIRFAPHFWFASAKVCSFFYSSKFFSRFFLKKMHFSVISRRKLWFDADLANVSQLVCLKWQTPFGVLHTVVDGFGKDLSVLFCIPCVAWLQETMWYFDLRIAGEWSAIVNQLDFVASGKDYFCTMCYIGILGRKRNPVDVVG